MKLYSKSKTEENIDDDKTLRLLTEKITWAA